MDFLLFFCPSNNLFDKAGWNHLAGVTSWIVATSGIFLGCTDDCMLKICITVLYG